MTQTMQQPIGPKFLHVAAPHRPGTFAPVAYCGRRVNLLNTTTPEQATCSRCRDKAIAATLGADDEVR